jgi:hypothetical protein
MPVEGALGAQQTKPLQGVTLASWKGAGQCCLKHLLVISIQNDSKTHLFNSGFAFSLNQE